jgi:hypothetical protein
MSECVMPAVRGAQWCAPLLKVCLRSRSHGFGNPIQPRPDLDASPTSSGIERAVDSVRDALVFLSDQLR